MGLITQSDVHHLGRLLTGLRPTWDLQAVYGALYAVKRDRGESTDAITIAVAALLAAQDRPDDPTAVTGDGPHWVAAERALLDAEPGRRWADRSSRRVLLAAEADVARRDPAVQARGVAAARAALAQRCTPVG